MAKYRVTSPDGATFEVTAPDDATPDQVRAYAEQNMPQAKPAREELFAEKLGRGVLNLGAGAIRGAGSIGATLKAPFDYAEQGMERLLGAPARATSINAQRRADMTAALGSLGADTDSLAFGAGKLGGEIAGTLGVGGTLANVAGRALPAAAAPVVDAIATAGMRAGGLTGPAGVAARTAGGAITGGASAALVSPEDAAQGAIIGGALPGVLQGAGAVGSKVSGAVRSAVASREAKAGAKIAKALDLNSQQAIDAAIAKLNAARVLVPGSTPTAAQALRTPQAGILQRVVSDGAGGGPLRDTLAAQSAARQAALERVAATNPAGLGAARQEFGETLGRFATSADEAARAKTRALYESVPQDDAALYLPELGGIRDQFFGRGSFTPRAAVDAAVRTAQEIGTDVVPAVKAARPGAASESLSQAVRRMGGLSIKQNSGLRGEVASMGQEFKNLVRQNGGMPPDRMAAAMVERGFLDEATPDALFEALRAEARGGRSVSAQTMRDGNFQAMREAAMGDAPAAQSVPKKVTLREFDNLRKSIGASARGAGKDPERAAEAAALSKMKSALDDRINEVVRGDGAIDENLPIAWADALDAARRSKLEQVQRFRTGPQADIFRMGSDGQPKVQGGEIAAKFWGSRPGVAEDVKALKRLIGDKPELLGQFRSMVTTEGAKTATNAGNLTGKFVRWVENTLPGLREAFDANQVKALQRIAADIKRAEVAAGAGMARGSNTYQNAQNALELGLLDNPLLKIAADRLPLGGFGLSRLQESARARQGRQFAELLASAGATANALQVAGQRAPSGPVANMLANPEFQTLLLRSAPVVSADR